jgi:hypothetical protein
MTDFNDCFCDLWMLIVGNWSWIRELCLGHPISLRLDHSNFQDRFKYLTWNYKKLIKFSDFRDFELSRFYVFETLSFWDIKFRDIATEPDSNNEVCSWWASCILRWFNFRQSNPRSEKAKIWFIQHSSAKCHTSNRSITISKRTRNDKYNGYFFTNLFHLLSAIPWSLMNQDKSWLYENWIAEISKTLLFILLLETVKQIPKPINHLL